MGKTIFTVAVVAAFIFGLLNTHIIIHKEGVGFTSKSKVELEDTYVDTRHWGPLEYASHPRISKYLIERGFDKSNRNIGKAREKILETYDNALEAMGRGK